MRTVRPILMSLALISAAGVPALAQSGSFGNAVLVGEDELIIAEPNPTFRAGAVYIYRKVGDAWQEASRIHAPDSERADGFGTVLASTGGTLFIGQRGGPLHTFEREGGDWRHTGTVRGDGVNGTDPGCGQYGYCGTDFGVELAAEGDWLLVGEPGTLPTPQRRPPGAPAEPLPEITPGAVHVYQRGAGGSWTQRGTLRPSDGAESDRFGATIAVADGRALIGAPNWSVVGDAKIEGVGRVYEFRLQNGRWQETGVLDSRIEQGANFGLSISMQGDVAVIGSPGSGAGYGAAFLYRGDSGSGGWTEQSRLAAYNSIAGDRFGDAVAIDGSDIWIGAPAPRGNDMGSVYVYRGSDDMYLDAPRRLRLTETVTRDAFGDKIFAAGGVSAVVATGMHHQSGAVYVYERDSAGDWQGGDMLVSAPDALGALTGEERRCTDGMVGPFECDDVELLAFVPNSILRAGASARGVRTNDNWGWTDPDTGREYALVGRNDGTSFIDITDPVNPVLIGDFPKPADTPPSQLWRDIKTYKNHAFIVADGAGAHGMQIFDLTRLRSVADPPALFDPDVHYTGFGSSHNIIINEETGFAYTVGNRAGGETCGGGLHMMNIQEPLEPRFVGCFVEERGTHDSQCVIYRGPDRDYQGRELCLNLNGGFFAISDVTDKDNPVAVARSTSPNSAYIHQGWLTEDHRYFYVDDESDVVRGNVPTTRTLIWDLSDVDDPVLTQQFMGSMTASAHNLYVKDGYVYQANYRYGLHILDISDPENPREVGSFDTSPYQDGPGFSGAWSNYPFFDSGTIIVTSLQEGLFILKKRDQPVF